MAPPQVQKEVNQRIEEIVQEMRRIGMWQEQPLPPEQFDFTQAFAMDTMTFAQWLQFIFVPRVRAAVAANQFPSSSSVGVQSVREFDGYVEASHLIELLSEFDALFG